MWSSIAASSGLASSRISSRASTSRCQGLTPRELHPDASAAPAAKHRKLKRPIFILAPRKYVLLFRQQLLHLRLEDRAVDRSKTLMCKAGHTMTVNQHARGHHVHPIRLRKLSRGIEAHVKCRIELMQKFLGVDTAHIQMDCNDGRPLPVIVVSHAL